MSEKKFKDLKKEIHIFFFGSWYQNHGFRTQLLDPYTWAKLLVEELLFCWFLVCFLVVLEIKTSALHTPLKYYTIGRIFQSFVRQEVEKYRRTGRERTRPQRLISQLFVVKFILYYWAISPAQLTSS